MGKRAGRIAAGYGRQKLQERQIALKRHVLSEDDQMFLVIAVPWQHGGIVKQGSRVEESDLPGGLVFLRPGQAAEQRNFDSRPESLQDLEGRVGVIVVNARNAGLRPDHELAFGGRLFGSLEIIVQRLFVLAVVVLQFRRQIQLDHGNFERADRLFAPQFFHPVKTVAGRERPKQNNGSDRNESPNASLAGNNSY